MQSHEDHSGDTEFQPQLFNWQFITSPVLHLLFRMKVSAPGSHLSRLISQVIQINACTWSLQEVQSTESRTTHAIPSPCQFARPSCRVITLAKYLSAVLYTLTEISSASLCATLSYWIVFREVTILFEVRVHFNNDFTEAKTLPHDPSKTVFLLTQ